VLLFWMSANRDDAEFEDPTAFDLSRASNRHVGFGIGVHRCAGSHLARMNLRIAIGALVGRLDGLRLAQDAPIGFHPGFTRSPNALELAFAPGPRES
jgi:cytochrome P450